MSKHTPSPWSFALDSEEGLYRLTAGKELVAKAVGQNQETDEANARLIAAAPELLEALKGELDAYEQGFISVADTGNYGPGGESESAYWQGKHLARLQAVIAKAEGR